MENGSYASAVQAEVARGKAGGLYIDQKIIKHGKIDQLTPDEVRKELQAIADQLNPKIVEGEVVDETVTSRKRKISKSH